MMNPNDAVYYFNFPQRLGSPLSGLFAAGNSRFEPLNCVPISPYNCKMAPVISVYSNFVSKWGKIIGKNKNKYKYKNPVDPDLAIYDLCSAPSPRNSRTFNVGEEDFVILLKLR